MKKQVNVAIVGGGMVGASLASALDNSGLSVAMIDARPVTAKQQPNSDGRSIALAHAGYLLLSNLGVWPKLASHATPIKHIHISEQGCFGKTRIKADDVGVDALGYVIPAEPLQAELFNHVVEKTNTQVFCPATVSHIQQHAHSATLTIDSEGSPIDIEADIVVAADGTQSNIREQLNIACHTTDEKRWAMVANIELQRHHQNIAYERFTPQGVIAMVPLTQNRCTVIWLAEESLKDELLSLSEEAFLSRLQTAFGYRLGKLLTLGRRHSFPLKTIIASQQVKDNVVLLGNAAHTLEPVAAQGFNLAVRDIASLSDVLRQAYQQDLTLNKSCLQQYDDWQRTYQQKTVKFTRALNKIFQHHFYLLSLARSLGLLGLDLCPPAKRHIATLSMGLAGRLGELLRK